MIIFFDIETISEFPGNARNLGGNNIIRSNENIEIYNIYDDYKSLQEKHGEGLSFMPEYNKILTITVGVKTVEGLKIENLPGSEKEQIEKFFEIASKQYNKVAPSFCGHNIKNFDLPFIIKRALKYGIKIPQRLKAHGKKPREMENILDLFEVYKYLSFSGKGSLDLICKFLNIPTPKEGIDGSQVQEYFDDWKEAEILEYCKRDVEATMKVYEKFLELNLI